MQEHVEKDNITTVKLKVLDDGIVRVVYPIYTEPKTESWINFNSTFYLPQKAIFGQVFNTYWVNVIVIWLMTFTIAIILYFDLLKKVVEGIGNFRENQMYRRRSKEEKED